MPASKRFDSRLDRAAQAALVGFPAAPLSAAGRLPFRGRRTLDERIALLYQHVPTVEGLTVAAFRTARRCARGVPGR
ncbi:hypothetical protein ACIRJM_02050 [Streptomyces sp. NPDC102405]|jgi:hypothetical protein|uniref:hypothetical protein n=1 Tax=Streptomyces sp. NPDC102405 TaxID=3366170 RepID=UPI00383022EE